MKIISKNKRAYFDYAFSKEFEAGIVLLGHEVKSLKGSNVNLRDAMAHISNQELRIKNLDIPLYANTAPALAPHYEAKRKRKLLLKAQEIGKIAGLLDKPGNVLIPTKIYINKRGLIKVTIAVAQLKRKIEKKQIIKERDMNKQMQKDIKKFM